MPQRSHHTQIMQNYFDATDVRTRENPVALEAQLLNLAGVELEDLNLRLVRETSLNLQDVPTNIDNDGIYHSLRVQDKYLTGPDQTTFEGVISTLNGIPTNLTVYNDTLPIPASVEVDKANVVRFTDPILFTVIGSGDDLFQAYTVQRVFPGAFPIPNILTVWIDDIGLNDVSVTLTIIGEVNPQPAWVSERKTTTEIVEVRGEGIAYSRNRWESIQQIEIRNLPVGVRLRGWSMPFNLPACLDSARPYTTPEDRDILYPRYWQVSNSNSLLYETYRAGKLTGLEPINSYSLTHVLVDIAVEPNTNGIFAASQDTLYYADRREYQADLSTTGITSEPLYGLQVVPDISKTGFGRYVVLSGVPYANSANVFQYRYTVLWFDSLNARYSILPDGSIGPADAGWRTGAPQPTSFGLTTSTDFEFRLETQDVNGVTTYDVVPYKNAPFIPASTIDMTTVVNTIQGIAFDSYDQLWVWDGLFAIPLIIHYAAYVFDADSKTIFATEPFDSISITV